ncbi:MAG: hypothetical protein R6W68_16265 [Ignavibacteriaceae bacterium]
MKKLFVPLAILLACTFFGCQENQITDPVLQLDKKAELPSGGWIKLCCPVLDPLSGPCEVRGSVYYKISQPIIIAEPNFVSKQDLKVKISIILEGELCDLLALSNHDRWSINGKSEHSLYFTQDEIKTVYKIYPVSNRKDIVLAVKYVVERGKVNISSLSLRQVFNNIITAY